MDNESVVRMLQIGLGSREELLELLWTENLPIVRKIIRETTGLTWWLDSDRADFEDMEQQSFLGVLEAVDRFDSSRGVKFFTFASHPIRKYIYRYYDQAGRGLRMPSYMKARIKAYLKAESELKAEGRHPTDAAVMERMGATSREFESTVQAVKRMELLSLDDYVRGNNGDSATLLDIVADENRGTGDAIESVYHAELHKTLMRAMSGITGIERNVIISRFYQKRTVKHIADMMGCTTQNVSRILSGAYRKMRTGKYAEELASFLPEKAGIRAAHRIEKELRELTEEERGLLL